MPPAWPLFANTFSCFDFDNNADIIIFDKEIMIVHCFLLLRVMKQICKDTLLLLEEAVQLLLVLLPLGLK